MDQFTNGFPILAAHGMHATFFVNTGPILAGDPAHMTWADLHVLASAGNEITGHVTWEIGPGPHIYPSRPSHGNDLLCRAEGVLASSNALMAAVRTLDE